MRFSRGVRYQWGLFKRKISSKSLEPFLRYGQKTSKMPQKWGFSPICDPPRFFFKNRALSLLYPYGALTSCKKLEKSLERSLRYLKTDGRTNGPRTDMGDYIGPSRVNPGSKMNIIITPNSRWMPRKIQKNQKHTDRPYLYPERIWKPYTFTLR